jgi:hypothetical protein
MMGVPSAAALIGAWDPASRAPPHQRLTALLAAIEGGAMIHEDTLGGRNCRLLLLHRALVGSPLEARVTCPHCAAQSEFALPTEAIVAAPAPDPGVRVRIRLGRRTLAFRLPRMSDIEAAQRASADGQDIRRAVLERCCSAKGAIPDGAAERLARKFEALDPAANIVISIACSGCARPIAASVDVATFVARDLDRLVDGLFRDVDMIASAYGWTEQAILALAPERRRRYVAMIAAARMPARRSVAGRRA